MLKLFLTSFILFSCGGGYIGGDGLSSTSRQEEESEAQEPEEFSTRLNSQLFIAGDRCEGGETTEVNGQIVVCPDNRYLIIVDNINTCNDLTCTQVGIFPVIGDLEAIQESSEEFSLFAIIPGEFATVEQREILNQLLVRSNSLGESDVIFKQ